MGCFFNQLLGIGKRLSSVLMIMKMGTDAGVTLLWEVLEGHQRVQGFSPFPAQHLSLSPKNPLSAHDLRTEDPIHYITAYLSFKSGASLMVFLGTILIS